MLQITPQDRLIPFTPKENPSSQLCFSVGRAENFHPKSNQFSTERVFGNDMGVSRQQQAWWILSAQAGDHEAFNDLLKSVQEPLFRYIVNMVNDRAIAEDILQEVFVRIYRKLGWLKEPEAFRPWAYQIATREVFRQMKRERHWAEQIRDEEKLNSVPANDEDEPLNSQLVETLPKLIENLPPKSRAVVVLRYLHELSVVETAAVLKIPVGTVKSRLSYGRRLLREQFQQRKL